MHLVHRADVSAAGFVERAVRTTPRWQNTKSLRVNSSPHSLHSAREYSKDREITRFVKALSYTKTGTASLDSLTDADSFASYMTKVGTAIDDVNGQLSMIGAMTGSFTFKEDQISAAQINLISPTITAPSVRSSLNPLISRSPAQPDTSPGGVSAP